MTPVELSCFALFRGRINVPTAASRCGLSTEQMKRKFVEYVTARPVEEWELDITPCWPYA